MTNPDTIEELDPAEATEHAAARLADIWPPTPLDEATMLSQQLGNIVLLKREDLGPTHAFKWRGSAVRIGQLSDTERKRGVIATSAGNHGQGTAREASKLGIQATIFMPTTTPSSKIEAVRSYGAQVVLVGDSYTETYKICQRELDEQPEDNRPVFIHPFNDPHVIAGQGTVGLEIMNDRPDATHIFVPVGGGGLLAGIAQYVKETSPDVEIIGVEPQNSNAMQLALQRGEVVDLPEPPGVFADGVAVRRVGNTTLQLAQRYVDRVVTVSDGEIGAAFADFWAETRVTLEPAGALALAGLKQVCRDEKLKDHVMVAVCSGANPSLMKVSRSIELAERHNGSKAIFTVELPEEPGALSKFCDEVVDGHNITELHYQLGERDWAQIFISFSIAGSDDREDFKQNMVNSGYVFNDLTDNDIAQDFALSSRKPAGAVTTNEHQYLISLPERSGALKEFLQKIGSEWNISLFHYKSRGSEVGQVLIGFEVDQPDKLENVLAGGGYKYQLFDPRSLDASYSC